MATSPVPRMSRATVFSAVCVALATVGHVLSSHAPVPAWAVATGFAATLGVCALLAGQERSLVTLLGGLLGGQFALHALFAAAQAPDHAHLAPGQDVPVQIGHGGLTMTLAHVAAGVVSAWWLRRGERAIWELARRLAAAAGRPVRALLAALAAGPHTPPPRIPLDAARPSVPARRVLRHQVVRRGPPLLSRALTQF